MAWSLGGNTPSMSVTSVSPSTAKAPGNAEGSVSLQVVATGFSGSVVLWLVMDGQPVIKGTNVKLSAVGGSQKVTADFDTTGWSVAAGKSLQLDVLVGTADLQSGAWAAPGSFALTG